MTILSLVRSLFKTHTPESRPQPIVSSKIKADIDELSRVVRNAIHDEDCSALSFKPNVEFLKNAARLDEEEIKKKYPDELIKAHLRNGFLEPSSAESNLRMARTDMLKSTLSSKGMKTSGKKADLISRILEGFSEKEILRLFPGSQYALTPSGQEAIDHHKADQKARRVAKAITLSQYILLNQQDLAAVMIRPKDSIAAGSDRWPEGIRRWIDDINCEDGSLIVAIVECRLLGVPQRTVIADFKTFGHDLNPQYFHEAFIGACAHSVAADAKYFNRSYKIEPCSCEGCKSLQRLIFSPSEAKVGESLPPFSLKCSADVEICM